MGLSDLPKNNNFDKKGVLWTFYQPWRISIAMSLEKIQGFEERTKRKGTYMGSTNSIYRNIVQLVGHKVI